MPVAINLFGSMRRMCMALGVNTLDDLARDVEEITTPKIPAGFLDAMKMLPMVNRLKDVLPKTVKDGPCQEVVKKGGTLDEIPILQTWPDDGGRYITLPLVFKWPSEGFTRPWPKKIATTDAAKRKAEEVWEKIGLGWKP